MHRLATLFLLCTAALVVTHPDRGRACSRGEPSVISRLVLPADDTTDVPINARVVIVYGMSRLPNLHFAPPLVRVAGAGTVAGETSTVITEASATLVFVPDVPLAPNTAYEVLDEICVQCGAETDASGSLSVVARFTTGVARDDTPPSPPSGTTANVRLDVCSDSSCCGPYEARRIDIHWDAIPQSALAQLDVDGAVTAYVTNPMALGWLRCFGGYSPGAQFEAPGLVSLRHVDVAGNLSASIFVPIDLPACNIDRPDDDQTAENSTAEVAEPEHTDEDGCGASRFGFGAFAQVLATLAMLTMRRGTRHSRAARAG